MSAADYVARIACYTLTQQDAININQRRPEILTPVAAGDVYPMVIMKSTSPTDETLVNGMVFPDGYDLFRVVNVKPGTGPGTYTL